jgi:ribonucleoside-diphosphate reductase alpha subunit
MSTTTVIKRDGTTQAFERSKVQRRINTIVSNMGLEQVNVDDLTDTISRGMSSRIESTTIDKEIARVGASFWHEPQYDRLAATIFASMLQKQVGESFSEAVKRAHEHSYLGEPCPLVADGFWKVVKDNAKVLDAAVCPENDYRMTYFGLRTLTRSYLLKSNDKTVFFETPQFMFLRVAVAIHTRPDGTLDTTRAMETYQSMSDLLYTHATPTLFNAGSRRQQLSSCFLLTMEDDSIQGIYKTISDCAAISKYAGGIGLSISTIRAAGSYIRGTNGHSNGIVPMLRVLNAGSCYVDQGGGKRKGSIAIYLEMWHSDVLQFLELKLVTGKEQSRARDLFYAVYASDLFMRRVENNEKWSLMCPNVSPGLSDVWGEDFEALYTRYEKEGKFVCQVNAQDVWYKILVSQAETGTPYMVFKDACNRKSNQQNLGTIRSSNLCTEVVQYSAPGEIAVCNLASVSLPRFVDDSGCFDYAMLHATVKQIVVNLNRVIDINYYPLEAARRSNIKHRPIGIGVQALADCLIKMGIVYDSEEGVETDRTIFEVIYHAAVESSCELAQTDGAYESFQGSPASEGRLQFDLWEETQQVYDAGFYKEQVWEEVKKAVKTHGLRNSLLVAPMPTASTSQIMGNFTQSFHPLPCVMYQRRTLSGDFVLAQPTFIAEMQRAGLWNKEMQNAVQREEGCVERIPGIPESIGRKYKSAFAMSQKWVVDHAVARGPFVCQSQSLNIFMAEVSAPKLTSLHFYTWKKGLKTGMYYLRSKAKKKTIAFGLDESTEEEECVSCSA